ncbi:hypothetical protein DY000_02010907 [Brassica cretica]|uniref:Cellulose synthase RING-type zinc finger domain-containing protein n=1 Tax=Brassica cretica TaxID=69181 RepID=A0ABQ7CT08_BRACR|nr:hypothetical protein DY000_02010907 [Brassica cretica]
MKMIESKSPVCNTCREETGVESNGEFFAACHECSFPICKACLEYEFKEGRRICLRCGKPYDENVLDDVETKTSKHQSTVATDSGIHARHISTVSTIDSELNDEYRNPIWKNRVDSWKVKKSKKKKKHAKATKAEDPDAQVPPQQHIEDISLNAEAASATDVLSVVIPIPRTKITSYRIVIIMRLTILALYFHYRITHPVDSAYGLLLTSVICEIWFAFLWVLDQFPKWSPINRM